MTKESVTTPSVRVGEVVFSAERPAIIVPIATSSLEAVMLELERILASDHEKDIDVIEWRIDHLLETVSVQQIVSFLPQMFRRFNSQRLLLTLRTHHEGGNIEVSDDRYLDIIQQLSPSLAGHLLDVEYSRSTVQKAIELAQANSITVIGSYHNFMETPAAVEISAHLRAIVHVGADIAKVAVMPNSSDDVLEALQASIQAASKLSRPIILISMGRLGVASRLSNGTFGSSATFATVGSSSAPGQLNIETVLGVRNEPPRLD